MGVRTTGRLRLVKVEVDGLQAVVFGGGGGSWHVEVVQRG